MFVSSLKIWVNWSKTRAARASQKVILVMLKHFVLWGPLRTKKKPHHYLLCRKYPAKSTVYRTIWVNWSKTRAARASQKVILVTLKHVVLWGPLRKKNHIITYSVASIP